MFLQDLFKKIRSFDKKDMAEEFTFNDLLVLKEINEVILSELNKEILFTKIVNITTKYLGCIGTLFIQFNEKNKTLSPKVVSQGVVTQIAIKLLGTQLNKFQQPIDKAETLSIKAFLDKKTQINNDLTKFICPPAPISWAKITQKLYRMATIIAVPVYTQNASFGVLVYSFKEKLEVLPKRLIKLLETYTSQIALALDRSSILERSENRAMELELKNRDLTTLFNLSTSISKTLDPSQVAQNAVNSLPQDEDMIGATISMYFPNEKSIRVVAASENDFSKRVKDLIGEFRQYAAYVDDEKFVNLVVVKAFKSRQPASTENIEEVLSPPVPKMFVPAIGKILNIKSTAVYPLITRGKIIGLLSFYLKNRTFNELEISQIQLLQTYTSQISIALENASLFERSQEIQKNLQETLNQLQEVRRRERDMIDVMGHELRTPITIVRNALLVMDSDYNNNKLPPDKLRKYLDMSIESVRREITLIETLLSATKVEGNRIQLTLKKVDLIDVVNDALEAHKKIAGNKNLAIDFVPPEQPVFVYADRVRTQEIMDNYVSNAIKYTVKGGVTIRISLENDIAKVAVTDTGVGISKEDLVNLGKKFFRAGKTFSRATTSTQPSGTGLGLFVAFELLRLMNGTKEIKSDMGKGSTFSFTLPLYKDQKETSMDQAFMKDNFVDGETEGESEL